jgi:hypothetical protein
MCAGAACSLLVILAIKHDEEPAQDEERHDDHNALEKEPAEEILRLVDEGKDPDDQEQDRDDGQVAEGLREAPQERSVAGSEALEPREQAVTAGSGEVVGWIGRSLLRPALTRRDTVIAREGGRSPVERTEGMSRH